MSAAIDDPTQPTDVPTGTPGSVPRRGPGRLAVVVTSLLVVVALLSTVAALHWLGASSDRSAAQGSSGTPPRASGIPADVPTSIATLMGLSPVPVAPAPAFSLVDQHGRSVSLSALRGHPVVLEFMDPQCVDICPIVSQEFIDAYRDLGSAGPSVVFLGVNVNAYHTDVASVAAYSTAHNLGSIASWHFLTGPVGSLESVWRGYGVSVSAPSPTADVVHTSVVYFIDSAGRERYVAFPMADHADDGSSYLPAGETASWGQGIALVAASLR